ncbi:MAG: hypothetical protein IJP70_06360 [Bacteroidales bacterium]|nr:hypothetical protein [Bacteroidales bacterium]
MKKHLLKTLLVAAGMLASGASVWADDVNISVSECAYVDLANSTTNYNGSDIDNLYASNTQFRNDGSSSAEGSIKFNTGGKLALFKFALSDIKNASGSLTSVTFKFTTTSSDNCYNIYAVGYNSDWSANTVTQATLTNNGSNKGTLDGTVTDTESFQPLGSGYSGLSCNNTTKNFDVDVTTYVESAIANNEDYISFAIGMNLSRTLTVSKTATLKGTFTTASATTYTVKYQNAEGTTLKADAVYDTYVGETYTASASDMATFYNGDSSKKYVYASGNTSTAATSTAANNVITLVFSEYDKVAYTVTAKNGETALGTLAEGNAYTDGSTTVYWNKFKKFNNQWYETNADYGKNITSAGNIDVAFTASGISYFYEFETLSRSGGSATVTETGISRSNNTVGRISNSSASYATLYTPALSAGVYELNMPYYNGNTPGDADKVYVYVTNDVASLGDPVETFSIVKNNYANFNAIITVPEGYFVAFQGARVYSNNSQARIDYLTLIPYKETKTISDAGWATYCCPYALDLENATGLTDAYIVTGGDNGVLEKTTVKGGTVPANTGLLLKGSAGTVTIPVVASSSTDVSDNILTGVTAATEIAAGTGWVLMNDATNGLGFYKNANAFTVGANTAYIPLAKLPEPAAGARKYYPLFEDETTGINAVQDEDVTANGYYNLQGQRVCQPAKGFYIVNGKKIMIK